MRASLRTDPGFNQSCFQDSNPILDADSNALRRNWKVYGRVFMCSPVGQMKTVFVYTHGKHCIRHNEADVFSKKRTHCTKTRAGPCATLLRSHLQSQLSHIVGPLASTPHFGNSQSWDCCAAILAIHHRLKQCTTGMNMQSGSVLHAILPHSPFPTVKVDYLIVYRPCLTVNNKLFQCGTNVCHILLCQSLVRQNFKICATLPFYACFGHAPLTQWHEECRTRY